MRAKPTSAEAFQEIQDSGADVSLQERIVYDLYHRGEATRRGLARRMGMEDRWSSLTARVRELLDLRLIREDGRKKDPETGAQGALLHVTENAVPWLKGEHDPEPIDRNTTTTISPAFMGTIKAAVDNPGSLTAWNDLKEAYENEVQE